MPSQVDITKHMATNGNLSMEDSEHVRLVISNERTTEAEILQLQTENRDTRIKWWIKAITLSIIAIILSIVFLKWGVPFLFEKVYNILVFLYYYTLKLLYYCCPKGIFVILVFV